MSTLIKGILLGILIGGAIAFASGFWFAISGSLSDWAVKQWEGHIAFSTNE